MTKVCRDKLCAPCRTFSCNPNGRHRVSDLPSGGVTLVQLTLNLHLVSEQIKKERHVLSTEEDDTLASRFTIRLLQWLFQGFLAKNTSVRFRSVQIVCELISHLGELEYVSNMPLCNYFKSTSVQRKHI